MSGLRWRTWSLSEYRIRPESGWDVSKARSLSLYDWGKKNNVCRSVGKKKKKKRRTSAGTSGVKKRSSSGSRGKSKCSSSSSTAKKTNRVTHVASPNGVQLLQKLAELTEQVKAYVCAVEGDTQVGKPVVDLISP